MLVIYLDRKNLIKYPQHKKAAAKNRKKKKQALKQKQSRKDVTNVLRSTKGLKKFEVYAYKSKHERCFAFNGPRQHFHCILTIHRTTFLHTSSAISHHNSWNTAPCQMVHIKQSHNIKNGVKYDEPEE